MDKKRDKKRSSGETTTTGWLIPAEVKDSFTKFCATKGSIIKEDCAGALVLWQYLPPEIREWARLEAKGIHSADQSEPTLRKRINDALDVRSPQAAHTTKEVKTRSPIDMSEVVASLAARVEELEYRLQHAEAQDEYQANENTKQASRRAKKKGAC